MVNYVAVVAGKVGTFAKRSKSPDKGSERDRMSCAADDR